jgi:hypothetical protein
MVVRLGKIKFLQLSIGVSTIDVDAWVSWHERDGLIKNSHRLMKPLLLEQTSAHVVIGQPDLDSYIVLKTLSEHELTCPLQVRQRLIIISLLPKDGGSEEQQPRHIMEKVKTFLDVIHREVLVALEDKLDRLFVILHSPWPLDGEELNHLMMLREYAVSCPEALIA